MKQFNHPCIFCEKITSSYGMHLQIQRHFSDKPYNCCICFNELVDASSRKRHEANWNRQNSCLEMGMWGLENQPVESGVSNGQPMVFQQSDQHQPSSYSSSMGTPTVQVGTLAPTLNGYNAEGMVQQQWQASSSGQTMQAGNFHAAPLANRGNPTPLPYRAQSMPPPYRGQSIPTIYRTQSMPATYPGQIMTPAFLGQSVPVYRGQLVSPVYNGQSIPPNYNGQPTTSGYSGPPVIPAYSGPAMIPVYNGQPLIPVYNGQPLIPAYNGQPLIPAYNGQPLIPAYNGQPIISAYTGQPIAQFYSGQPLTQFYSGQPLTQYYSTQPSTHAHSRQSSAQAVTRQTAPQTVTKQPSPHANTRQPSPQAVSRQTTAQTFNGQPSPQAHYGYSKFSGPPAPQAFSGQSAPQAFHGQSASQAFHGQSAPQAFNGQSAPQAFSGQYSPSAYRGKPTFQAFHGKSTTPAYRAQQGAPIYAGHPIAAAFYTGQPISPAHRGRRPRLQICPMRYVNITSRPLSFLIQMAGLPHDFTVEPEMIEVYVKTPSRLQIPCVVGSLAILRNRGAQVFQGYFQTTLEAGWYHLQVRLILPLASSRGRYEIVKDEINIKVSRNYPRGEFEVPCPQLQVGTLGGPGFVRGGTLTYNKVVTRMYSRNNGTDFLQPANRRGLLDFYGDSSFNHPNSNPQNMTQRRIFVGDHDHDHDNTTICSLCWNVRPKRGRSYKYENPSSEDELDYLEGDTSRNE